MKLTHNLDLRQRSKKEENDFQGMGTHMTNNMDPHYRLYEDETTTQTALTTGATDDKKDFGQQRIHNGEVFFDPPPQYRWDQHAHGSLQIPNHNSFNYGQMPDGSDQDDIIHNQQLDQNTHQTFVIDDFNVGKDPNTAFSAPDLAFMDGIFVYSSPELP